MDKTNRDVVGDKCIWNDTGELSLCDNKKLEAWIEHYSRLLNVEFDRPPDSLVDVSPFASPATGVSTDMIRKALCLMKGGKAAGLSGIIAEMMKTSGDEGIGLLRMLTEAIFVSGSVPKEWEESYIINYVQRQRCSLTLW